MNRKQMKVMWIGIIVFVLMGLFPPSDDDEYEFIFATWEPLAFKKLFLQWFMVAVVTGGLIVTFRDKKPKDELKQ